MPSKKISLRLFVSAFVRICPYLSVFFAEFLIYLVEKLFMELEIWKLVIQSGIGGIVGVASFFVFQYFNKRQDDKEKTISERYEKTITDLINRYETEKKDLREEYHVKEELANKREEFLVNQLLERVDNKTYQMLDILKSFQADRNKNNQLETLQAIRDKIETFLPKTNE